MKAALLGTQHYRVTQTEREILLAAGAAGFRRMAGYTPPQMPVKIPTLSPVANSFAAYADAMMTELCGEAVPGCIPRVPYLVLAWLLIGSDNEYRVFQYTIEPLIFSQVARQLLWIALGYELSLTDKATLGDIITIDSNVPYDMSVASMAILRSVAMYLVGVYNDFPMAFRYVLYIVEKMMGVLVKESLQLQAMLWRDIDDDMAWAIARSLMLDILSAPIES